MGGQNGASVGRSERRVDAILKVTGQAVYGTDLEVPGMLYARIFRSTVPHARIRRIDASAALQVPGVRAVVTGADLTGIEPYYGMAYKDQPILAIDVVRYQGEPVAGVVADTPEAATAALELIEVDYEELPAADTLEKALAKDAPLVHEGLRSSGAFRDLRKLNPIEGTNICHHYKVRLGDVEKGFAEADAIFEDTYHLPSVQHYAMEPYVVIADYQDDLITVWSATQHPFPVRRELSEIFKVPQSRIRLIVPLIGGAYGCKCYTKLEPLAVVLSRHVRRPVKVVTTVEESFLTLRRHSSVCRVKTGVKRDGTIVAREVEVYLDTGAYADTGPRVAQKSGYRAIGPYRIPNLKIDSHAVYTHTVPAGAYRGYGTSQVNWAIECQMDAIAEWLKMDPAEFRRMNLRNKGEEYAPGDTPLDGDIRQSLQAAIDGINWKAPRQPGRGKGVGIGVKDGGGTHTVSVGTVRLYSDGSVSVHAGSVEIGQGARTVLAQIVATELGVPFHQVTVADLDSATTPFDQGTSASRSTVSMGIALQEAARKVRQQLLEIASSAMDCPIELLEVADGYVKSPTKSMSFAELVAEYFGLPGGELVGVGTYRPAAFHGTMGGAVSFWEVGVGAAEIEVDEETGLIRLVRYCSAADIGKAINPTLAEGQDEGGTMQGVGHTLLEALVFENGQLLNGSLVDYRVPTFADLPEHFETVLIENGDGPGPFGSKGVGETGIVTPLPAITNALQQALGIRLKKLPLTPENVWRALQEKKLKAAGEAAGAGTGISRAAVGN